MDPSLYNPVMMPSRTDYVREMAGKAKQERQAKAAPWAQAIGTGLGAIAGSLLAPGAGTMAGASLGASIGGALGGAAAGLFGGGAAREAEQNAEESYDAMYASEMADRNKAISDAMAQVRQDAYLSEIQNMRKNVMPNRAEYLKFV
jgi:high-affinity Fe2+/Pb2+ permease